MKNVIQLRENGKKEKETRLRQLAKNENEVLKAKIDLLKIEKEDKLLKQNTDIKKVCSANYKFKFNFSKQNQYNTYLQD